MPKSRKKKRKKPPKQKRKLTAAEKRAKREQKKKFMTIFVNGKQKRVPRPPTIDGLSEEEFIAQNADPIWLHQNEMWEYMSAVDEYTDAIEGEIGNMDKDQEKYLKFNEEFERKQAERKARGEDETESVWSSSYVNPSLKGVSTMTLSFRLSEIITDLKVSDTEQCHVTALNEIFDMVRIAPPNLDDRRLAVEGMKLAIEAAVKDCRALTSKAADFQSQLDEWLRQPLPEGDDVPF